MPSTYWPTAKGVLVCPQHGLEKGIFLFLRDLGLAAGARTQAWPAGTSASPGYCRALPQAGVGPHDGLWNKKPAGISFQVYKWGKNPGTEMLLLVTQADLYHFSHFYGSWTLHSGDLNQWHPCLAAIKWIKLVYLPPGNPIFPFWADPDCAPAEN